MWVFSIIILIISYVTVFSQSITSFFVSHKITEKLWIQNIKLFTIINYVQPILT